MQKHNRRRMLRTSLAIENSDAINRHAVIGRCRGCHFSEEFPPDDQRSTPPQQEEKLL